MSGQSANCKTVTEILSDRLQRLVRDVDRSRALLHVLDWTGCAVAGNASPAGQAMRNAVGDSASPLDRVLYTGAIGNVLEMDDVDKRALLHPGPVVIPAAMAAASMVSCDSATFLDGIVRGYEAVIRVGRAVGPTHYRMWHNTGTCGPFGAVAAAASIFHLDTEKMSAALGLAGTQASGFWQTRHEPASQAKQLHTARSAHGGLLAAHLVRSGFVGLTSVLEGEQGFFAATCGDADPFSVVDFDRDAPWAIHDVSFKPWPACRHAHAAIDAALALRANGLDHNGIEKVNIHTYKDALVFCDKASPTDTLSAKFSLQHAVAVSLINGAPTLAEFDVDALSMSAIAELRSKCVVTEDVAFTKGYPARFGSSVEIVMKDGTSFSHEIPDALGDPENPISEEMLFAKATMLIEAAGVPNALSKRLIDAVRALDTDENAFDHFASVLDKEILV